MNESVNGKKSIKLSNDDRTSGDNSQSVQRVQSSELMGSDVFDIIEMEIPKRNA